MTARVNNRCLHTGKFRSRSFFFWRWMLLTATKVGEWDSEVPAEYSISPSSFLFRELKHDQIPLTCCDSSSIKYRECSGIARLLLRFPFKSWTSSGDYVTAWVGNENANNSSLSKATIINKIPTSVAFRASLWPSAVLMYLEMTGSRSSVVYR